MQQRYTTLDRSYYEFNEYGYIQSRLPSGIREEKKHKDYSVSRDLDTACLVS